MLFVFLIGIPLFVGCVKQPVSTSDFPDFSIKYTMNYAWKGYIDIITVSTTGDFDYRILDYGTDNVRSNISRRLSGSDLKNLSHFVIREKKFFSLPEKLTEHCLDASDEFIEVEFEGKKHKTGGYCVQNKAFRSIVQKLNYWVNQYYLCKQRVEGSGDCEEFQEGYEFDGSVGKCVKKGVSGCSFSVPFSTLEDCQKVCEQS